MPSLSAQQALVAIFCQSDTLCRLHWQLPSTIQAQQGLCFKLFLSAVLIWLQYQIAVDLRHCSGLRVISLESNRLTTPVLDLRALSQLRSLQLYGNPLEFLMELSPCTALRHLSLANVRMSSDPTFLKWEVEVVAMSYMGRTNKLSALFAIIFRRSACQHPLLAGALGASRFCTQQSHV